MRGKTSLSSPPESLVAAVSRQPIQAIPTKLLPLTDQLQQRFGSALEAILLYGSSLHGSTLDGSVIDFYVLVDDYRHAYHEKMLRYLNAWLAPNVFYLEVSTSNGGTLRAKYAVISTLHFEKGASNWFHPYIWARFAQPFELLYGCNERIVQRIRFAQAQAIIKFLKTTLPTLPAGEVTVEQIWASGLQLTYAAELRAERRSRSSLLVEINLPAYQCLTIAALPALNPLLVLNASNRYMVETSPAQQFKARFGWRLRRWQGRVLSILRLSKATLTFRDCLDYAAWKIERHTGVKVEITPMLRRHPMLWGYKVMWQLLRRGVLR
ncbi:MAG: hypothetical protein RQ714_03550 [Nitrosomonas sp.]|nr:hypothetical protein [Nitrosomonas sp.]